MNHKGLKIVLWLFMSLITFGCGAKPPSPPAPQRISDAYAKAALKALDTIAAHTTQSRITDALFNADAEATSGEETALTKKLYSIYKQEQDNESARRLLAVASEGEKQEYMYDPPVKREIQRARRNLEAKIKEMDRREMSCYEILADALRRRSALSPKECDSIAVPVVAACYNIFADRRSAPATKGCDSVPGPIENPAP
ncbi:MAG: hypothetical protein ACYDHE_14285 [Candidatus Acidiferrales bacterium]